jgi:hypothetical protein
MFITRLATKKLIFKQKKITRKYTKSSHLLGPKKNPSLHQWQIR